MKALRFGLLLMAGAGALAQTPDPGREKLKQEMATRINQIKALKSQQQGPAYLLKHLYEAKPEPGVWFLEIKVDDSRTNGLSLPVVHLKGIGKSQMLVTQLVSELERRKDWFPTVTLRSIRANPGDGEAGMEGREFELDVTAAALTETRPADKKSDVAPGALEGEFERCKAFMPLDEQMGGLIQSLNRAALESNLRITSVEPQPGSNDRGFYQEKTVRMSVAGGYRDIASYFDKIGLFTRIITLRNLSLKRGGPEGGPGSRDLNGVFDAVIYLQKPLKVAYAAPKHAPEAENSTACLLQGELSYGHLFYLRAG